MIYEISKAIESIRHPGIRTNPLKLMRNAFPYYAYPSMRAAAPLTIYWSINSVCNLRCKMCDVGTSDESGTFYKNLRIDKTLQEVSIEKFKEVIDAVAADKPYISINSTEPLIYKQIGEAVRYCTANGLESAITTGGYLLPKKAEELVDAGLSRLNISIDGPSAVHNSIRGRPDSFERDMEGIEKFRIAAEKKGSKPEIILNCTISNLNYRSLTEFVDTVEKLPVDRINFAFLWYIDDKIAAEHNALFKEQFPVSSSCSGDEIKPWEIDTDFLFNEIQSLKKRKKVQFMSDFSQKELYTYFKEPEKFVRPGGRCLASWFFMQVIANGSVIPYTRCHNSSFGNINTQSFEEIWNGPKMLGWRKFIKNQQKMPMCRRCDLAY